MNTILKIVMGCVSAIICANGAAAQGVLKGKVFDSHTLEALVGATVIVEGEEQLNMITNEKGRFSDRLSPGLYDITVSHVGYQAVRIENYELLAGKDGILEIKVEQYAYDIQEVVVEPLVDLSNLTNEFVSSSAYLMSMDEMSHYAGGRHDIARISANLPGVVSNNDQRNDVVIRGNTPIGVQWNIGGVPILNPNHFATLGTTGGAVTILNPNLIDHIDFVVSAFPAQYGNVLSGVFDLDFRKGNDEEMEFMLQLGAFTGLEALVEGPIKKESSSFLISYRHSFADFANDFGLLDFDEVPEYKDLNFHLAFNQNKKSRWSIWGMGGDSNIEFTDESDDDFENFASTLVNIGVENKYLLNKGYVKTTVGWNYSESTYEDVDLDSSTGSYLYQENNEQQRYFIASHLVLKPSHVTVLNFGVLAELNSLDLQTTEEIRDESQDLLDVDDHIGLTRIYAQMRHSMKNDVELTVGLNNVYNHFLSRVYVEPRLSLSKMLGNQQKIALSYGYHTMSQPLSVQFYSSTEDNMSVQTNAELEPTRAHHVNLSYSRQLGQLTFISNVYYQSLHDVPIESVSSSYSTLNEGAEFTPTIKPNLQNDGRGRNYGIECAINRKLSDYWYYLLSATYFSSRYLASDEVWRDTKFNTGFGVNALIGKSFYVSDNSRFSVDFKSSWIGGQRYTPVDLIESKELGRTVFQEDLAFSEAFRNYIRSDIRFGYRINGRKRAVSHSFFVEIQNMTNRENPRRNRYSRSLDAEVFDDHLGFFFDLLYRINF